MNDDSAGQLAEENVRLRRQLAEREAGLARLAEGSTQPGRRPAHHAGPISHRDDRLPSTSRTHHLRQRWTLLKLAAALTGMMGVSAYFAAWRRRKGVHDRIVSRLDLPRSSGSSE
jgi:hypothetical protein